MYECSDARENRDSDSYNSRFAIEIRSEQTERANIEIAIFRVVNMNADAYTAHTLLTLLAQETWIL